MGETLTVTSDRVERARWSQWWAPLFVIMFGSFVPFAWRHVAGAGAIPAGDAWAYERIFDTFHRTGNIRLVGWNDITLLGMLPVSELWVTIVGYGPERLHLLGSVMCMVALAGVWSLGRSLDIVRISPIIGAIAVSSALVGIAGTYLSDSFALAGAIWAIALAARLRRPSCTSPAARTVIAAAAGVAGAFGFMVRQHMLIGMVCAVVALITVADRRRLLLAAGLGFALPAVPAYLWRSSMVNGGELQIALHPRGIVEGLEACWIGLGLAAVLAASWTRRQRFILTRSLAVPVAVAALVVATGIAATWPVLRPADPLLLALRQEFGLVIASLLSIPWLLAATAGWCYLVVTGGQLVREYHANRVTPRREARAAARKPVHAAIRRGLALAANCTDEQLLGALVVVSLAADISVIVSTGAYFHRYGLVTCSLLTIWILRGPITRTAIAWLVTALVGLGAYWALDHSVAPANAIWRGAEIAECLGIPAERYDGGFSWNGGHFAGVASVAETEFPEDGLPPTDDRLPFVGMTRDAALVRWKPEPTDRFIVLGPIQSDGILPGNRTTWWLAVRSSAITGDATRCWAT